MNENEEMELGTMFSSGTEQEIRLALERFLERDESRLAAYALVLTGGNQSDADDLMGILKLQLLVKHLRFNPQLGAWHPWARAVLRGCASGERRKKKRIRQLSELEGTQISSSDPSISPSEISEFEKAMRQCVGTLTESQKAVFFYRTLQRFSWPTITALLQLGQSTSPAIDRFREAQKQLRRCLSSKGYGPEDLS